MLACGVYTPTRGSIQLDGIDLATLDDTARRQSISVISQDPFLIHDTLDANLRLAAPTATTSNIARALKDAHLDDFVAALPHGLNTVVGDRGYRLSGGERQRLALARAFLTQPDVVILDEATAHLDVRTERAINAALDHRFDGAIRLVIAHRLSTIRHANSIVVMDQGSIIQHGTHEDLASTNGPYRRLLAAAD